MNRLYNIKLPYLSSILITLVVFGVGFWYLNAGYFLGELSLPIAGCIVIYFVFGKSGFFILFTKSKKGFGLTVFLAWLFGFILAVTARQIGHIFGVMSSSNIVGDTFESGNIVAIVKEFVLSGIQIIGEELITIIPLIIIVNLLLHMKVSKKWAITLAVIVTCILFGALHLSTYNWNLYQCFVVIGIARLPFTLATLKQNTIWAGIVAHIVFDWSLFLITAIATFFQLS